MAGKLKNKRNGLRVKNQTLIIEIELQRAWSYGEVSKININEYTNIYIYRYIYVSLQYTHIHRFLKDLSKQHEAIFVRQPIFFNSVPSPKTKSM